MTDAQIETERVAGDLQLVLRDGTVEEKASMLRLFKALRTEADYITIRDSYGLTDYGTEAP